MRWAWPERVRQFLAASTAFCPPEDDAFARRWLPAAAWRRFLEQGAYERRHSVALARRLLAGAAIPDHSLLEAALLHDYGKARAHLTPWQRAAFVLLSALPGRPLRCLRSARPLSPLFPLWVLQHHPALGADALRGTGLSDRALWLIAHHHDRAADPDLRLLQGADEGTVVQESGR